jgi:hypothetical protein
VNGSSKTWQHSPLPHSIITTKTGSTLPLSFYESLNLGAVVVLQPSLSMNNVSQDTTNLFLVRDLSYYNILLLFNEEIKSPLFATISHRIGDLSYYNILLLFNEEIKSPLFATISHRIFIIHVSYYMFRLYISHLQVYHV